MEGEDVPIQAWKRLPAFNWSCPLTRPVIVDGSKELYVSKRVVGSTELYVSNSECIGLVLVFCCLLVFARIFGTFDGLQDSSQSRMRDAGYVSFRTILRKYLNVRIHIMILHFKQLKLKQLGNALRVAFRARH